MPQKRESENQGEYIAGALFFKLKPKTAWWLVTAIAGLGTYVGFGR